MNIDIVSASFHSISLVCSVKVQSIFSFCPNKYRFSKKFSSKSHKMDNSNDFKHSNISSDFGDFQMVVDDCFSFVSGYFNNTSSSLKNDSQFLDANDNQFNATIIRKSISPRRNVTFMLDTIGEEEEEPEFEPPLLEELEIYPEQIRERAMTMLNPFVTNELANEKFLADSDLFGPIFFCFLFGSCLFLAGKVFIFSHLYGLAMVSVLGMYGLLKLMCYGHQAHFITIRGVASALGYGMLHMVWFSFVGIFMGLTTVNGFLFGAPAVFLSTIGASRLLGMMSHQTKNNLLIAYPTAMVYILFSFLIIF